MNRLFPPPPPLLQLELWYSHPIPLPEKVLQTSSCTILLCKCVIQSVLGMGMGMNVTAHNCCLALLAAALLEGPTATRYWVHAWCTCACLRGAICTRGEKEIRARVRLVSCGSCDTLVSGFSLTIVIANAIARHVISRRRILPRLRKMCAGVRACSTRCLAPPLPCNALSAVDDSLSVPGVWFACFPARATHHGFFSIGFYLTGKVNGQMRVSEGTLVLGVSRPHPSPSSTTSLRDFTHAAHGAHSRALTRGAHFCAPVHDDRAVQPSGAKVKKSKSSSATWSQQRMPLGAGPFLKLRHLSWNSRTHPRHFYGEGGGWPPRLRGATERAAKTAWAARGGRECRPKHSRGTKGGSQGGGSGHRSTWGSEHAKHWERNAIKPVVTYDPHSLGPPYLVPS